MAIHRFNNKDMGHNIRLLVKISESKRHREERKKILKEEADFAKTLHCSRSDVGFEQPESDDEAEEELSNPLQPRYVSPAKAVEAVSPNSSLNISRSNQKDEKGPNCSLQDTGKDDLDQHTSSRSHDQDDSVPLGKPCIACQKPAASRCSRCKMAYCTEACQREDWPRHKGECVRTGASTVNPTISVPASSIAAVPESIDIQIAEGSDDEGFVLDCPSAEELAGVKQILHNAKTSDELASLLADSVSSPITFGGDVEGGFQTTPKGRGSRLLGVTQEVSRVAPGSKVLGQEPTYASPVHKDSMCPSQLDKSSIECFVQVESIYSQLEHLEQPLLSLPPLSSPPPEFSAIVTFYTSPCEFNVIIPSVETKQALLLMQSSAITLVTGSVSASQLSPGLKCGYKDKQGCFIRAVIREVKSDAEILIAGYDFGGLYSVHASDLIQLPGELGFIPCLTHKCVLHNVEVSQHGKNDLISSICAFKELVNNRPILVRSCGLKTGYITCSILARDSGQDLIDSLLLTNYVTKKPIASCSTEPKGQRTLPLRLSYSASKVNYHVVQPGTTVVLLPTVVVNPSIIWAQVNHPYLKNMEDLHSDMNVCYPPADASSNPYVPATGEMCVAKYSQDQKYYRAEVLRVHHNGMADVRFTETGRCENLTVSQLYHINPKFLTLPKQARKFSLNGIEPNQSITWSDNAIAFLKDKILNRYVNVKILSVSPEHVLVDMYDPDLPNQLMSNSLVLLGHAQISQSDKPERISLKTSLQGLRVCESQSNYGYFDASPVVSANLNNSSPQTPVISRSNSIAPDSNESIHKPNTLSLSEGDIVDVSLSHLNTLERFYLQLVEPSHVSKVEAVLGKISKTKLVPLPQKHITKGTFCLCRFTEDNEVHRAQIIGCKDNKVVIVFKDYGNVFHCTTDLVYKISEELLELPFQAIACSLNQVKNPAGSKMAWDPTALSYFQKLLESGQLKAKVVKVVGVLHIVDLKVISSRGEENVLQTMIKAGYVTPRTREQKTNLQKGGTRISQKEQQQSKKTQVFKDTLTTGKLQKLHQNDKSSSFSEKSFPGNRHLSSPGNGQSGVGVCKESSSYSPSQSDVHTGSKDEIFQNTVKSISQTPTNSMHSATPAPPNVEEQFPSISLFKKITFQENVPSTEVIVTEVVSLNEMYVQLVTSESMSAMETVSESLASISSSGSKASLTGLPPVNSLCCAKFSQDNMWYRSSVESVCKSDNTVSVQFIDYGNRDTVHASDIVTCPTECKYVPIVAVKCSYAGIASMEVDEFRALAFIKKYTSDSTVISARVSFVKDGIPFISLRSKDFDFQAEMADQGILKHKKKVNLYPLVNHLEKMSLPSDTCNVKVIISEVISLREVYVQIACNEVRELLMKIGEGLNSVLPSDPSSPNQLPEVGRLCCAKFSTDKHWYRAAVLEIVENSALVQFVDYGNRESVTLDNILPCPSEFSSHPLLAIRCALEGMQFIKSFEEEKIIQYIHQHSDNSVFSPEITGNDDGIVLLSLRNDAGDTLLGELQAQGLITCQLKSCLAKTIPRVQLPETLEFQILMGEFHSSSKFYIQLATTENGLILQSIAEGLNKRSTPLDIFDNFPDVGILCCAKFSVDNLWYRAELLSISQGSCEVFFVDYGNYEKVTLANLALCPSELASLPMQAIECGLNCIPSEQQFEENMIQYFRQNLSDKLLVAKVEEIKDNIPQLRVLKDGHNILDEVVQQHSLSRADNMDMDLKSSELPLDEFKCIITEVVSPLKFYVQVAVIATSTMIDMITQGINDTSRPLVPLASLPRIGMLCCAKFSVDMQWYRVEITEVNDTKSKVFFVDYGNHDEVLNSNLAVCPKEFVALPKIAVECGLNGFPANISSVDKCISYLKTITNKLLMAQVVGANNHIPLVNIRNDGMDILPKIIELINTSVLVKDMACIDLPSKSFEAMVSEVINSREVYVQIATTEVVGHLVKRISLELTNIDQGEYTFSLPPAEGTLCCAKFPSDMQWYRAEVICVQGNEIKVFFIDYGNFEVVPICNLAPCPHTLAALPRIASKCAIQGIPSELSMSDEINKYLKQNLLGELVTVTATYISEENVYLDIEKDGKNLVKEMLQVGILGNFSKKCFVKDLGTITLPTEELFQVIISEVVSHKELYVQVVTQEVKALLSEVAERINTASNPLQALPAAPEVGIICCAKFTDNLWYRAEVLKISGEQVLVKFVDYGNTASVNLSDIASCPSELTAEPCAAIHCGWANTHSDVSTDFSQALNDHANKVLLAKFAGLENNVPQLELFDNNDNLLQKIFSSKTSASESSLIFTKSMKRVSLPSDTDFKVLVSEIVSPKEFYVQLATTEVGGLLNDITCIVNRKSPPLKEFEYGLPEGALCCAKFSEDQQWYRAEVQQKKGSSYSVRFVDFGNISIVPASDLAMCPSECSDLPLVACQCSLSGYPVDTNSSSEVLEVFKNLTSTTSFVSAKLVAEKDGIFEVELSNYGECIINKLLHVMSSIVQSLPLVSEMEKMQIPSLHTSLSVSVTEIISLEEVYIQFATQQVAMMLNDLSDGLNEILESNHQKLTYSPAIGSLCCAKYSIDSLWYRAKILAIEGDKYAVQFIDYGNKDVLLPSNLAACPSQFENLPVLSVCCGLTGIPTDLVESTEKIIDFLKGITYDIETTLELVDVVNNIPLVKLFVDGTDVVTLLETQGLIKTVSYVPANLSMLKFPSTTRRVKCLIYEVRSLSEFYLHVNNDERSSVLSKLEEGIHEIFSGDSPKHLVTPPAIGDLCLAKFSGDSNWYRARVENVNGDELDVLYLDYRNFETVHISDVLPCPVHLASLPQLAMQCGLYGLPSGVVSTDKYISTFKNLTNDSVLEGQKICEIEGVPQVELVKDGKNVISFLGFPESDITLFSNMKKLQLPSSSETFQLVVCEIITPSELYIQVNNGATVSAIKIVTEALKNTSELAQLPSCPPVGSVCCAKFSQDGLWYRARVDKVTANKCQVFFFDFGNFEEVSLSEMTSCPSSLLNIPVIAIKCCLHGVESLSSQEWSPSATSILKSITMERLLNASVVSNKLGDIPVLQLMDVVNGTLVSVEFKSKYQSSCNSLVSLRKCQVTEVNNPGSLYFQFLEVDNANNLSLLNKLQEMYADPAAYSDFIPTVGSLCCARYSGDMNWYRCKILSITTEAVRLSYIDFGSIDSVTKAEVYRLDDMFTAQPPFAVHVKIRGIGPKDGGSWTKVAINKLADLCDKILYVLVEGQEGGISCVDLFEDEKRQSSVADILVSCGHAMYI